MLNPMRTSIALALCAALLCQVAAAREWTDATGQYKTQAELVGVKDGMVALKRQSDGAVIQVPLAKLSAADQAYLKSLDSDSAGATAAAPSALPLKTADCTALLVLDPKPILSHKAFNSPPLNNFLEMAQMEAGINIKAIDRATVLFPKFAPESIAESDEMPLVAVIEFTEAIDPMAMIGTMPGEFTKTTVAGKTCHKPDTPDLPVICIVDEQTLAFAGTEQILADALAATEDDTDLSALLAAAGDKNDVRYVLNVAAMQDLLAVAKAEMPPEAPPQAQQAIAAVEKMTSVTFTVDLDGPPSIELVMAAADDAAAAEIKTAIEEGLAQRPELAKQAAQDAPPGAPMPMPGVNPQMMAQMAQNVDKAFTVEQASATVKMSVNFPSDAPPLVDQIAQAAAAMAMFMGGGAGGGPFGGPGN